MNKEQVKRQIVFLEFYLKGRMQQLTHIGEKSPADKVATDMAKAELLTIYNQVLPDLQKSVK